METEKLIQVMKLCAYGIRYGMCDKEKCYVAQMTNRKNFPQCCADMWLEAADRLQKLNKCVDEMREEICELDERISIMTECEGGADESFDYGEG